MDIISIEQVGNQLQLFGRLKAQNWLVTEGSFQLTPKLAVIPLCLQTVLKVPGDNILQLCNLTTNRMVPDLLIFREAKKYSYGLKQVSENIS